MKSKKYVFILTAVAVMFCVMFGVLQEASAEGKILIYSPWKDGVMKEFRDLFEP